LFIDLYYKVNIITRIYNKRFSSNTLFNGFIYTSILSLPPFNSIHLNYIYFKIIVYRTSIYGQVSIEINFK